MVSQRSGYQLQKGFEGTLLSRTGKFQPESFELYKRGVQARNYSLSSIIEMHDEEVADQLLWGFTSFPKLKAAGFSAQLQPSLAAITRRFYQGRNTGNEVLYP